MSSSHSHDFTQLEDGLDVTESASDFESHYRSVSVSADTDENTSIDITETYDPAVEDVQHVIARCADNLRLLIRRNGH
jgi:hypothetical protein